MKTVIIYILSKRMNRNKDTSLELEKYQIICFSEVKKVVCTLYTRQASHKKDSMTF